MSDDVTAVAPPSTEISLADTADNIPVVPPEVTSQAGQSEPAEPDPAQPDAVARPPIPAALQVSMTSVFALSMVAIFFVVYAVGFSALQEQRSQHQLYASFRGLIDPSSPIAPRIGGEIPPGSPVALINAKQAGLQNTMIVEGTSSSDLMKGPGHLRDTPLPGQTGQSIVMGRSLTAGAPFAHISHLRIGDTITVETGQGNFRFTVKDVRTPGDVKPAIPSGGSLLTLITSKGSGAVGSLAPGNVVYVDALLQGATAPAPTGTSGKLLYAPIAVPTNELPGHNDPAAWPFIALWLIALVAAGVAAVWSWVRWGRWQTWLVASPILLGVLWGLSEETTRLLSNLV